MPACALVRHATATSGRDFESITFVSEPSTTTYCLGDKNGPWCVIERIHDGGRGCIFEDKKVAADPAVREYASSAAASGSCNG